MKNSVIKDSVMEDAVMKNSVIKNSVAKKHILIVDDDRDLSFIICDMLESYGYEVSSAADANGAYYIL